jgi:hypothetical protein
MGKFEIEKLTKGIKVAPCESCFEYDNLDSNVNYLENYGQQYYDRMAASFAELKKITGNKRPHILSFGCGCCLDYIACKENFGDNFSYTPIDKCEWAIMQTEQYKNLTSGMPKKSLSFNDGIMLLQMIPDNAAICFFNSLNDILNDKPNSQTTLASVLSTKSNFYLVCNFTVTSNFTLAMTEQNFIDELLKELNTKFVFKKFDILGGKGILIQGQKK